MLLVGVLFVAARMYALFVATAVELPLWNFELDRAMTWSREHDGCGWCRTCQLGEPWRDLYLALIR